MFSLILLVHYLYFNLFAFFWVSVIPVLHACLKVKFGKEHAINICSWDILLTITIIRIIIIDHKNNIKLVIIILLLVCLAILFHFVSARSSCLLRGRELQHTSHGLLRPMQRALLWCMPAYASALLALQPLFPVDFAYNSGARQHRSSGWTLEATRAIASEASGRI